MAKKNRNAPAGAQNMKMFYGILALVAVLGIGAILYARSQTAGMATEPLNLAEIGDANELLRQARGVTLGQQDAPVQIHVFSDYMCPACATWAGQIESQLKLEFIDQGLVQLTYYDFPLGGAHRYSFAASRAARCAGDQDRFWEYHDRLFATQQSWSYSSDVPVSSFLQIGRDVGVEPRSFEECLRGDTHADVVTANRMLGETLGVGGTPTVFLNGRPLREWNNYSAVRAAVQAAGGV